MMKLSYDDLPLSLATQNAKIKTYCNNNCFEHTAKNWRVIIVYVVSSTTGRECVMTVAISSVFVLCQFLSLFSSTHYFQFN